LNTKAPGVIPAAVALPIRTVTVLAALTKAVNSKPATKAVVGVASTKSPREAPDTVAVWSLVTLVAIKGKVRIGIREGALSTSKAHKFRAIVVIPIYYHATLWGRNM